eukprot:NODE_950_length_2826_cov_0.272094.p1 type:complete len:257 gc:universal NODE_950_length_2826_cov_0.272094:1096-1866(+)
MFWLICSVFTSRLRGLDPKLQSRYSGTDFTCDGNIKIPISSVNDDYCDCKDGTDEIGTSACSNGEFYCHNDGMPLRIPSSWVDDGRQDCCDGTDEQNGTNTCAEFKIRLDAKKQELHNRLKDGIAEKKKYIEFGLNFRENSKKRIVEIDTITKTLEKEIKDDSVKVHEIEKGEQFENDLFQCSQFCLDNYSKRYESIFEELKTQKDVPEYVKTALEEYESIKSNPEPSAPVVESEGILSKIIGWIPFMSSTMGFQH